MSKTRLGAWWLCLAVGFSALSAESGCGRSKGIQANSCSQASDCADNESCTDGECVPSNVGVGGEETAGSGGSYVPGGGGDAAAGGTLAVGGTAGTAAFAGEAAGGEAPVDPCLSCGKDQVCQAGSCVDIVCTPDSTLCVDGNVWQCDSQGLSKALSKDCASDEYCVAQGDSALCSPTQCVANEALCVGQVATSCRADGSGPRAGGEDCAANGEVCYQGQCLTQGCTPGEKLCEHDDVYLCSMNGTGVMLFEACNDNEACDPNVAQCRNKLCEPGKLVCDGSRVASCDALGLSWQQTGTDCADSNALCIDGSCKPKICTPSSTYCKDNAIYTCDAQGVSSQLTQQCADAYYCGPWYNNAVYCWNDVCTAGSAVCNGNSVSTCKPDGSGVQPGGTPCAADELCNGGVCKAKICTAYQTFCKDNNVAYCYDGLQYYNQVVCGSNAVCQGGAGAAHCEPYDCTPNATTCLGNQVGKCDDTGFALASVTDDCASSSQICDGNDACADSAVDTLADAEELVTVSTQLMLGVAVDTSSSRTLTEIEANLVLPATRDLTWSVYELVSGTYVLRFSKAVAGQTGSGYMSSGTISYQLAAGKTYLFTVNAASGSFAAYYDAAPWSASAASFGRILGGFLNYSYALQSYYVNASQVYQMRISTAP